MYITAMFQLKKSFALTILICGVALICHGEYSMEYVGKRTNLFYKGARIDFLQCVKQQLQRYPESRLRDMVLLARQASGQAAIKNRKQAWENFSKAFAAVSPADLPLFEIISPDFCRVNLVAWKKAGLPGKWLFNMSCASAEMFPQDSAILNEYITQLCSFFGKKRTELEEFVKSQHHSRQFLEKYAPSYRVINTRFLTAFPVLLAAAKLPEKTVTIIAVDGKAASGKTTLAKYLALILEADAIHMDDFFLPLALRSKKRLAEPGGNVHYERFKIEVLPFLRQQKSFSYQRFDCSRMQLGAKRNISASRWRIVEGAYSLHPEFGNYADLKVFFDITPAVQLARIRKRNGERKAKEFSTRWIPMEEKYISAFNIKKQADIIIGN